jgi:hypothetical protein
MRKPWVKTLLVAGIAIVLVVASAVVTLLIWGSPASKPTNYTASFTVADGQNNVQQYGLTVSLTTTESTPIDGQTKVTLTLSTTTSVTVRVVLNLRGWKSDPRKAHPSKGDFSADYATFPFQGDVADVIAVQNYGWTELNGLDDFDHNTLVGVTIYIIKK